MRFSLSLSLWIKSWQPLQVYFKQSQWFLERWKTHEGHNEKQAENLTAGQRETRVIKNTASSSSGKQAGRQAGRSPLHCTPPRQGFSRGCHHGSHSKLRAFHCWAPLPFAGDPCCMSLVLSTQLLLAAGGGSHGRKREQETQTATQRPGPLQKLCYPDQK